MSLDMFLYKEIYIGANYDFSEVTGTIDIKKRNKPIKVNFNKVVSIIESVAKWNSAHHIHQWFVDNIQDGDDDCKRYCVSGEKLLELRYVCKDILNQKTTDEKIETAKELLSIYDRT